MTPGKPEEAAFSSTVREVLEGGGEMGALMRATDWSATPLGPVEAWPQSLRSALSICIGSRFPIAIYWGPKLALLYNDAWKPIPGRKHPWALGRPAMEVWPEIWDAIGPLFDQVMNTGEATYSEDSLLPMHRHGYTEECYFNFTFTPIRGEGGYVEGVFNAVVETTFRVISERRTQVLRALGERLALARSADEACSLAAEALATSREDVPFCALYLKEGSQRARLVAARGVAPGGPVAPQTIPLDEQTQVWPLSAAERSTRVVIAGSIADRLGEAPASAWPEPVNSALIAPISAASGGTSGFLVVGASPRREIDEEYRQFVARAASQVAGVIATTAAYEAERKRAEALAEIDRAKTAFFSNVSHEFRTPLTLMLGPVEDSLGDREQPLPPRQRERQQVVHRNSLRLLKLVNALLDFSRIEAGRVKASFEPTDLSKLTADLASGFRSAMEKAGLAFRIECRPLSAPVFVDRDMWEKIVLNLLSNAFKFTFEGRIEVSLRPVDGKVSLSVKDTGTGIPESELPHLFRRFHRVEGAKSRTHEGSGIGLALVQELVKMHGGEISVESRAGAGSTFTVTIPFGDAHLPREQIRPGDRRGHGSGATAFVEEALRWLPQEAVPEPPPRPESWLSRPPPRRMARIVLADDNADMREYAAGLLRKEGFQVRAFADGAAALAAVRQKPPDLVLTDVMMPMLDGFGLLRELRADPTTATVPVILLSARAGEEARVEGFDAGADDYLVKPFSARELVARVRAYVELSRLRRAAETERDRLQMLLAQVPAAVNFLRTDELIFEFAHPVTTRTLGRDVRGKPLLEAIPEFRDQPFPDLLRHVLRSGQRVEGRERLARLDLDQSGVPRDTYWNYTYLPVMNADGEIDGVMTFDIDVTEQVLARNALRDANQRKDEFLAMLAHELRNPLAALRTALAVMERADGDLATLQRLREVCNRQIENLVRLVDDLLDVSRITRGKVELRKEPVNLAAIVQNAVQTTRATIESRGHQLSVELAPGAFALEADATRLEQVVANLLTNAAKYTDPGGQISVELRRETVDGAPWATLRVRDNGRGIPEAMLDQVFEPFVQVSSSLDRTGEGLGIGLTLVKRLVEMHGGTAAALSEGPGKGTEFVIRIPLPSAAPLATASLSAAPPRRNPGSRRILVVEDNEDAREMLKELLEHLGHEVDVAGDGRSGLEKVLELLPDVAIVDVGLPGIDGYELARRVREAPRGKELYLVALTGYGGADARARAEEAGFDRHLVKPLNVDELSRMVDRPG